MKISYQGSVIFFLSIGMTTEYHTNSTANVKYCHLLNFLKFNLQLINTFIKATELRGLVLQDPDQHL